MLIVLVSLATLAAAQEKLFAKTLSEEKADVLFFGDSHVLLAIDDSKVPRWKNYGAIAEDYYFTFYKMKKVLDRQTTVNQVVLGFSPHNISSYRSGSFQYKKGQSVIDRYFFLLPIAQKARLLRANRYAFLPFFKSLYKVGVYDILHPKSMAIFGETKYKFNDAVANDSLIEARIQVQFFYTNGMRNFSAFSENYLDSIVRLCKQRDVPLALINPPVYKSYLERVPQAYLEKCNELVKQKGLHSINCQEFALSRDCFLPDGDHLSEKGAIIFTSYLLENEKMLLPQPIDLE